MQNPTPRIGVIGCGAVTERRHLPALAELGITPSLLVDPNLQRAQELGARCCGARVADSYEPWVAEIDAAIVASPHHLHAAAATDLLRRGIHVLVEKPMAVTGVECDAVIAAAEQGKAVLAVGLMRRFIHGARWLKGALDAGVLGRIRSFDVREGFVYGWPVASGFFFRKETAGGGVLADTGAHTLDLLLWWLGDVATFKYRDDSYGGVEADCLLELSLNNGATGIVELSRTRNLRQSVIIRGERGELEISLAERKLNQITAPPQILDHNTGSLVGSRLPKQQFKELFTAQIRDWLEAIETRRPPLVSGVEGARAVRLIEACYGRRELLELPWVHVPEVQPRAALRLAR